jgi:SPP1 family predicted phage head-tail adaptor
MTIQAGKLRHLIVIQKKSTSRDSCGGELPASWVPFASVRASVEPLQGREYTSASGDKAEATTRFRLRHLSGVTASMRVLFEGRVFQLVSPPIDPNMQHRELHLMTVETEEEP